MKIFAKITALLLTLLLSRCSTEVGDLLPETILLDGLNPPLYNISGTVVGLLGLNLVLSNGSDTVTLSAAAGADVNFTFPIPVRTDTQLNVQVQIYPNTPTQLCTIENGNQIVGNNHIDNILVTCIDAYLISGIISGLTGRGLTLQNTVTTIGGTTYQDYYIVNPGDTTFTFHTPLQPESTYDVVVLTQPSTPWQTCTFNGSTVGVVNQNDVNLPQLSCTTANFNIGVNITNLQNSGMQIQLNVDPPVDVAPGTTSHTFGTYPSGTTYAISLVQPVEQSCNLSGALTGVVEGADVILDIICSNPNSYQVAGNISGLSSGGLSIELSKNGSPVETISPLTGTTNYTFNTTFLAGETYSVAITAPSPGLSCSFDGTPLSGTVSGTVTLPNISCGPLPEVSNVLIAVKDANSVALQWNDPVDANFDHVEITWAPGGATPQIVASGTQYFAIGGLTTNTAYTFTVKTVDIFGNASFGIASSATPVLCAPNIVDIFGSDHIDFDYSGAQQVWRGSTYYRAYTGSGGSPLDITGWVGFNITSIPDYAIITTMEYYSFAQAVYGSPLVRASYSNGSNFWSNAGAQFSDLPRTVLEISPPYTPTSSAYNMWPLVLASFDFSGDLVDNWLVIGLDNANTAYSYAYMTATNAAGNKPYLRISYSCP